MVKVLFVCMGNICRSPTAEGAFAHKTLQHKLEHMIEIDSAGTHAYHVGEPPDRRAQKAASKRGMDLSAQKARRIHENDFEVFDIILAMDDDNLNNMLAICPQEYQHKVELFLPYAPHLDVTEVPDPYYGGTAGFERVLDLIEEASDGLLEAISKKHL